MANEGYTEVLFFFFSQYSRAGSKPMARLWAESLLGLKRGLCEEPPKTKENSGVTKKTQVQCLCSPDSTPTLRCPPPKIPKIPRPTPNKTRHRPLAFRRVCGHRLHQARWSLVWQLFVLFGASPSGRSPSSWFVLVVRPRNVVIPNLHVTISDQ